MKLAIVTQPLLANYGGILQNYALQEALRHMGHEPVTIDYQQHISPKKYCRALLRTILKGAPYKPFYQKRPESFDAFIKKHINCSPEVRHYKSSLLNGIDAVIVGSDQVWRPIYNQYSLEDMFLRFAKGFNGPRIAYAASFGSNSWNPSRCRAVKCATLAKQFTAVSVREESGIQLCKDSLGIDAVQMPDPVFLLEARDYLDICKGIQKSKEVYLFAYILDRTPAVDAQIEELSGETGLKVVYCSSGEESTMPVEGWLAAIRDAAAVVTDSFHGCAISRILNKDLVVVKNEARGADRFSIFDSEMDFAAMRTKAYGFLNKALGI